MPSQRRRRKIFQSLDLNQMKIVRIESILFGIEEKITWPTKPFCYV
jgi:hypothetical protein